MLRWLSPADADFILALLNEPSFLANIGDKGVRSVTDARSYILDGPLASYAEFGFGLYLVELQETGAAMGICGLLKRAALDDVDLGFAFLPQFWAQGYAREAALAVMAYARQTLGLGRVVAITLPGNHRSIHLLEKIGFSFEKMISLAEGEPELKLFASELASDAGQ